jgi:hypothetical protein
MLQSSTSLARRIRITPVVYLHRVAGVAVLRLPVMVAEAVQAQVAVVTATLKGIHFLD